MSAAVTNGRRKLQLRRIIAALKSGHVLYRKTAFMLKKKRSGWNYGKLCAHLIKQTSWTIQIKIIHLTVALPLKLWLSCLFGLAAIHTSYIPLYQLKLLGLKWLISNCSRERKRKQFNLKKRSHVATSTALHCGYSVPLDILLCKSGVTDH